MKYSKDCYQRCFQKFLHLDFHPDFLSSECSDLDYELELSKPSSFTSFKNISIDLPYAFGHRFLLSFFGSLPHLICVCAFRHTGVGGKHT